MSRHIFKYDYIRGSIYDTEDEDYANQILEDTAVIAFCEKQIEYLSNDWTYQYEFSTCDACKEAYSFQTLGELP